MTYYDKKYLEDYIEERIAGLSYPINFRGPVKKKFNILDIKVIYEGKGPPSKLQPVEGGFIIHTRVPVHKEKDFRYVIAHEFTHTYFYEKVGTKEIPKHIPQPKEESLCEYGARTILIPRRIITSELPSNYNINDIINLSKKLIVWPHWLINRLTFDLHIDDLGFILYRYDSSSLTRLKTISNLNVPLKSSILQKTRKYLKEYSDKTTICFEQVYLGSSQMNRLFNVEFYKENVDLFRKHIFVLIRPVKK